VTRVVLSALSLATGFTTLASMSDNTNYYLNFSEQVFLRDSF